MFMAQADSCMSAVRHQVNNRSKKKRTHEPGEEPLHVLVFLRRANNKQKEKNKEPSSKL